MTSDKEIRKTIELFVIELFYSLFRSVRSKRTHRSSNLHRTSTGRSSTRHRKCHGANTTGYQTCGHTHNKCTLLKTSPTSNHHDHSKVDSERKLKPQKWLCLFSLLSVCVGSPRQFSPQYFTSMRIISWRWTWSWRECCMLCLLMFYRRWTRWWTRWYIPSPTLSSQLP